MLEKKQFDILECLESKKENLSQRKIAKLQTLHHREQFLMKMLMKERSQLAQLLTENIYNTTK